METKSNMHKLSDTLIYSLECCARITRVLAHRFFDESEDINITFNEYIIIDALYLNPKIHQRDLAKLLFKGTANLSRELEKLEKRGLIKRMADIKGKRIVKTLILTSLGEQIYHNTSIFVRNHIRNIESVFSKKEHDEFIFLISKLQNTLTDSNDLIFG